MLETPILFMVFNRPETTRLVFEEIRRARPQRLFVAADGPRTDREGEIAKCAQVRQIATQVDWECEITTLFRDRNEGCGVAPSRSITWFFEHASQGIILEDDCVPHPSFFRYCEEMLAYYADNPKVGQITGGNFQHGQKRGMASYYFSKYFHIWGWATWKDRWQEYDFELRRAADFRSGKLIERQCKSSKEQSFWHRKLNMLEGGRRRDIWDYQWMYANWAKGRLSAVPNVNLISNIGFRADATHTVKTDSRVADLPTVDIGTIVHAHATRVEEDKAADKYTFFRSGVYFQPSFQDLIRWKIKSMMPEAAKTFIRQAVLNRT